MVFGSKIKSIRTHRTLVMNTAPLHVESSLAGRLRSISAKAVEKNTAAARQSDEAFHKSRVENEKNEMNKILGSLEEMLTRVAEEEGVTQAIVVNDISRLTTESVEFMKGELTKLGLSCIEKPEFDSGTDARWTELWVSWEEKSA